jgi:hypothetical protein
MNQALPSNLRGRRLEEVPNDDNDDDSFLVLQTLVIGLICLFYILYICQLVRRWILRWQGNSDVEDTVLAHEERVFNLKGNQRRAVLEAIFSETSPPDSTHSSNHGELAPASPKLVLPDLPTTTCLVGVALPPTIRSVLTETDLGDCHTDSPIERLEENLSLPNPLGRRESFTTVTSEYTSDDENTVTGDNVCPICLCGYEKSDVLIEAKHCTHVFHKDCILEWLDKHDDCPMCREDMVTDSEMNRAATLLVGKTRMCRAMASMQKTGRL